MFFLPLFFRFFFGSARSRLSIWDGEEITCDNILQAFTEYNDTISFEQQAFINSLGEMREFLGKSPQEIIDSRVQAVDKISDARNKRIIQKSTIEDMGIGIMDILEDCIQTE